MRPLRLVDKGETAPKTTLFGICFSCALVLIMKTGAVGANSAGDDRPLAVWCQTAFDATLCFRTLDVGDLALLFLHVGPMRLNMW
jgi:hypothetical protein